MPIAALSLLVAGAAAIFILYPHLRGAAALVLAVFGALLAWILFDEGSETIAGGARIPIDQITLDSVALAEDDRFLRLTGRVTNRSDSYLLRSFTTEVTIYDCPEDETPRETCAIIAQDSGIARPDVPPGQTRSFEAVIRFSSRPPAEGVEVWEERIIETRATEE